jgi:regulatory protein
VSNLEKEIFIKICRFCAYRERCESEVREKLHSWEVTQELQEKILAKLKDENFLNEQRFARIYTLGKHRNNKWGRQKIRMGLKEKKLKSEWIETAMQELNEEEYLNTLDTLVEKKLRKVKAQNVFELRKKIATSLMQKGYEGELVWDLLKEKVK